MDRRHHLSHRMSRLPSGTPPSSKAVAATVGAPMVHDDEHRRCALALRVAPACSPRPVLQSPLPAGMRERGRQTAPTTSKRAGDLRVRHGRARDLVPCFLYCCAWQATGNKQWQPSRVGAPGFPRRTPCFEKAVGSRGRGSPPGPHDRRAGEEARAHLVQLLHAALLVQRRSSRSKAVGPRAARKWSPELLCQSPASCCHRVIAGTLSHAASDGRSRGSRIWS